MAHDQNREAIRTRHYRAGDPLYRAKAKLGSPMFHHVLRQEINLLRPNAGLSQLSHSEKAHIYGRMDQIAEDWQPSLEVEA